MKQRGFTLIELMFVGVMLSIVGIIILNAVFGSTNGHTSYSYGPNGVIEVRCMNNLKFVVGERGHVTQMLDENGKGISCNDLIHKL